MASRLKSTKEYLLAVLVPMATVEIPFWHEHSIGINQAEKEINQFDVSTKVFYFDQNSETSFRERVDEIIQDTFDGVFMVPVFYQESLRLIVHCEEKFIPCLLFDTNIPNQAYASFIGQNAFDSGFLAAELFHYCLPADSSVLIINIVKEHDNHLQFDKRLAGFEAFFDQLPHPNSTKRIKFESRQGMNSAVEQELINQLNSIDSLAGAFQKYPERVTLYNLSPFFPLFQ